MYVFAVTLCSGLWNINHIVLQKVIELHCNSFIMAVAFLISQVWATLNRFHKGQQQHSASLLLPFAPIRWDLEWILAEKNTTHICLKECCLKNLCCSLNGLNFFSAFGIKWSATRARGSQRHSRFTGSAWATTPGVHLLPPPLSFYPQASLKGGLTEQSINRQYK